MIAGYFHEGSGLGDQLFRYITVRTLARDKGYGWGMSGTFKADFFFEAMKGATIPEDDKWPFFNGYWNEIDLRIEGDDRRSYDPEINFVKDNTIIDGSFEDDKYWRHNLANINRWLAVEPLVVPDNLCVIGFRGGEYASIPEVFLPKEYYETAVKRMLEINPKMQFQVHTDDPLMANEYLKDIGAPISIVPNERISHSRHSNMAYNWRSARFAKYAIIPNSAFFILPRILRHQDTIATTVAPRYWAGRNQKIWKRPACFYPEFTYI